MYLVIGAHPEFFQHLFVIRSRPPPHTASTLILMGVALCIYVCVCFSKLKHVQLLYYEVLDVIETVRLCVCLSVCVSVCVYVSVCVCLSSYVSVCECLFV